MMETAIKQDPSSISATKTTNHNGKTQNKTRKRSKDNSSQKRRKCVSTACIACRRRKSKCDGAQPACAACVSVYYTECIYDPSSDHRRKGVYKKDVGGLKTRNSTLHTLIQGILNFPEDEVPGLVAKIRACENLDRVAESIIAQHEEIDSSDEASPSYSPDISENQDEGPTFESRLASKVGDLKLDPSSVRILGGTSNLLFLEDKREEDDKAAHLSSHQKSGDSVTSWTTVTSDRPLILHLLSHYFAWHYTFFTILPKEAFYQQFYLGKPLTRTQRNSEFCTSLLVNAILALGCHFTSAPGARRNPEDPDTAGDHFFLEAKRQIFEQEELATPCLPTVQALALMSVREAGCGRESHGWVYSGMAFRMACDLGLNFHASSFSSMKQPSITSNDEKEDARRITFWGCFVIDKCWSQYLGRLPLFQLSTNTTTPKFDVLRAEDSDKWSPYYDSGYNETNSQLARARTVALHISTLCEISSDLIKNFYHPQDIEKLSSKQLEMKHLRDIHSRLEEWRRELPKELEVKEGTLPSILVMHMMFQLLYIHLFRPFLKYNQQTSPLPSHVSPRRFCTQAAGSISKLLRVYKRSYGLRQIVNIAVYICHSACTIHLLNLPEKTARSDFIHGVKHLEEIADGWMCARRALYVLSTQAQRWNIHLPGEAASILSRIDTKYGKRSTSPTETLDPGSSSQALQNDFRHLYNQLASPQKHTYGYDTTGTTLANISASALSPLAWAKPNSFDKTPPFNLSQPRDPASYTISATPTTDRSYVSPHNSNISSPEQQPQVLEYHRPHLHQKSAPLQAKPDSRKRKEAEMFGGVEALLREGQDWWLKDQASLADRFRAWP